MPNTSFSHVFTFVRETKGTWVYEVKLAAGERISGNNQVYLLKSEYPTKPGEKVEVSYKVL